MRMYDIIQKKKKGNALTGDEIRFMTEGYVKGEIPDYQMSALLMAVCFQGMSKEETLALTLAMRDSGEVLDLSGIQGIKVDKHSTGGVGDKTSLVLAPMTAALGIPVAKMSGRGLGHTGGTIDKLECFPGFSTALTREQFCRNVNRMNMAIMGQTADLAPADKKLYALRDVTATVDQLSLIAASIMSKKLAAGADAVVLDVKTGSGAFMKEEKDAFALAEEMVEIGKSAGKKMAAVITDMDQPLGNAVGNSLEVKEAILALNGLGPKDLMEVVYALGAEMVLAAGKADTKEGAEELLKQTIQKKTALDKLAEFVEAQGGERRYVYQPELLPAAGIQMQVINTETGYVGGIQAEEIGLASLILGGGRVTKDSPIDLSVGILLHKKRGQAVQPGEALATVYANDMEKAKEAYGKIVRAYSILPEAPEELPMIKGILH
ncbi:pyrimidine-nucleoside phosphorylase [Lachnospiraceae bacterium]|jgi:pyrimidine-nucleoside phosphorylase|nr:pyrimidine-nucleoside phosphorylase [Lachnospiraceae bacterium]